VGSIPAQLQPYGWKSIWENGKQKNKWAYLQPYPHTLFLINPQNGKE
jgi:hypothetical protein